MALPLYDERSTPRTPWVTWGLIAVNVVVFLCLQPTLFQSGTTDEFGEIEATIQEVREFFSFTERWGLIPCEATSQETVADGADCDGKFSPFRPPKDKNWLVSFLSAMFVHGGVAHLVGNMLFLWIFGRTVEPRLRGPGYLVFYLVTGVIASLAYIAFHTESAEPLVGASGAIAGVMGAYVVLYPRSRIMTLVPGIVTQLVYVPAFVVLGLFFAGQFFTPEVAGVAWEAHVGGMVAGAVAALALRPLLPKPAAATF